MAFGPIASYTHTSLPLAAAADDDNTGSGKSHLAKMFRDIEKESHALCRILCLDDYFLQVCRRACNLDGWMEVG